MGNAGTSQPEEDTRRHLVDLTILSGSIDLRAGEQHGPQLLVAVGG